jgi:hypothetical protein
MPQTKKQRVYSVYVTVEQRRTTEVEYLVEATSPEEAVERYKAGEVEPALVEENGPWWHDEMEDIEEKPETARAEEYDEVEDDEVEDPEPE